MNLAELKALNAAEEEKAKNPEAKPEESEVIPDEPASVDEVEEVEKPEEEESTETDSEEGEGSESQKGEVEPWMQSEESADEEKEEAKFTDSDAANIRRKFKAKLAAKEEEKNAEIEKLKREVEALKTQKAVVASPQNKEKPRRDQFNDDDEFFEALTDYKISLLQDQGKSAQAAEERKRQIEREQAEVEAAVDAHYARAAKLAEKSGIKPESYQAADRKVREVVDSIFPQGGDAITDKLISLIGEGSEKVFYHLGVNPSKMAKFRESFMLDKTGLAASAYLGKLNAELSMPAKRQSVAPKPGADVQGDAAGKTSLRALSEQYKEALRKGDGQKAYNIKKKAREAGHDTKGW